MTATIQQLTEVGPTDVDELTGMLETLIRADAALGWAEPPDAREVGDLLQSLVDAGPSEAQVVVAREDVDDGGPRARIVGFGYWKRYPRTTLRPNADLERLAVATGFDGHGLGRAMLRELVRSAREAGIEQLTIDFRGDNHRAERLYLSEGFREYGRLPDFVAPDAERRFDKVFQVLDLRQ